MPRVSAYRIQSVARAYAMHPQARVPFRRILEMAGASDDVLDDPDATLELLHEAGAVETACRELDDKSFAARVGLAAGAPGTLAAYLVRASDTVDEAMEFFNDRCGEFVGFYA